MRWTEEGIRAVEEERAHNAGPGSDEWRDYYGDSKPNAAWHEHKRKAEAEKVVVEIVPEKKKLPVRFTNNMSIDTLRRNTEKLVALRAEELGEKPKEKVEVTKAEYEAIAEKIKAERRAEMEAKAAVPVEMPQSKPFDPKAYIEQVLSNES